MLIYIAFFAAITQLDDVWVIGQPSIGKWHQITPMLGKSLMISRRQLLIREHQHMVFAEQFVQFQPSSVIDRSHI
jgi:hypothetical protein